jgi:hypothetical protein
MNSRNIIIAFYLFIQPTTGFTESNSIDRKPAVLDPPAIKVKPCDDEALKEIYSIISTDSEGSFSQLYENTLKKINDTRFEAKTKAAKDPLNLSSNAKKSIEKLEMAFEKYGKNNSLRKISRTYDETVKNVKDRCEFITSDKLLTENTTHLTFASSILDEQSKFNKEDVAILWAVDRLMNSIKQPDDFKSIKADSKSILQKSKVQNFFKSASIQLKSLLKNCWSRGNENCAECQIEAEENFKNEVSKMKFIHQGLSEKVLLSENAQMEKDLKGKIGSTSFEGLDLFKSKESKFKDCQKLQNKKRAR